MAGGENDPGGGFAASFGAPLLRAVGLGISARGGMAGPFFASIGDSIQNARDERLKSDVLANFLPGVLAGVQRSREIPGTAKPGTPGTPAIPGAPSEMPPSRVAPPTLTSKAAVGPDEAEFQKWYGWRSNQFGLDLNPDAPEHQYDYRAAFRSGADVDPRTGHWPSQFKTADHPNRFIDGVDTITGQMAPPDAEAILPGTPGTPSTPGTPGTPAQTSTWQSSPTMSEALARLQGMGGAPASRALALQYLLKAGLPSTEEVPRATERQIELAQAADQQRALDAETRARRGPVYAAALAPGAGPEALGAAATEGMGGIHPATQAEQLQMQEIKRRRDLGTSLAQQLRAQAQGATAAGPEIPGAAGLPPFSAFQATPEQKKNRLMMVAAAAESGDPAAIAEAQKLIGSPDLNVQDVLHYGQAAHAIRPPEITLTPERIKLIASGEIVDPRLTQEGAKKVLASDEASAIRVAGAKATATAAGREAGTPGMTGDALDIAANNYIATRTLPAMGMGGTTQRVRIINRAGEIMRDRGIPFDDLPQRQAAFKAAQGELNQLQAQRGKVMAFADTADKNLDMALQMSAKVPRIGIPQINAWLQTGQTKWTGDPALAGFAAATRVGINETAKVTSGQVSGVSTDTARKEIENMLNTAQTPDAFRQVVETLRLDMANRKAGYMGQIDEIHRSMRSLSGAPQAGSPASGAAPPPAVSGGSPQRGQASPSPGWGKAQVVR